MHPIKVRFVCNIYSHRQNICNGQHIPTSQLSVNISDTFIFL